MTRRILSDVDGKVEGFQYSDDEICLVLSDAARVGLLKLIGSMSRNDLAARKLTDQEVEAVSALYTIHLN